MPQRQLQGFFCPGCERCARPVSGSAVATPSSPRMSSKARDRQLVGKGDLGGLARAQIGARGPAGPGSASPPGVLGANATLSAFGRRSAKLRAGALSQPLGEALPRARNGASATAAQPAHQFASI